MTLSRQAIANSCLHIINEQYKKLFLQRHREAAGFQGEYKDDGEWL